MSYSFPTKRVKAPRSWLMDRIRGQSKYNDRERPPGPCCWVSPVVGWCPFLLETNIFCRCMGKCGFTGSEFFRFFCLHLGFIANIFAMIGTSYAAISISLEFWLLSKASMEILEVRDLLGDTDEDATLYLGLSGVAIDQPSLYTSPLGRGFVVGYDDLCGIAPSGLYVDPRKDCGSCASGYFKMNAVMSLMIAVPLFFPSFFTQQLRMYSGYDVNCAKNLLSVIGVCIVLLNLNVMVSYFYLCSKESFYEEPVVYLDPSGEIVPEEDAAHAMEFRWRWGWGLIALVAGTGLKVIDVLCNVAVPTPWVTRDRGEQELYETLVFVDPSAIAAPIADEEEYDDEVVTDDGEEYDEVIEE